MHLPPFSADQEAAYKGINRFLDGSFEQRWISIQGLAGTGKTTVASRVAQERRLPMIAFTGKAASVLNRKTGLLASTIHAYIYDVEMYVIDGIPYPKFTDKYGDGDLAGDVAILDESSMVNTELAQDILRTGMRIIAFGDPGQLPPVVGEQFFDTADFTLTEPHRQALESAIIRQAYRARSGLPYENDGPDFVVSRRLSKDVLMSAGMVLCFRNSTRRDLTILMREMRGLDRSYPQPGEPVMCLRNAKEYGIYNGESYTLLHPFKDGDTSIVIDVNGEATEVYDVTFECIPSRLRPRDVISSFDFGYARTVHKSQGSEDRHVLIVDEYPLYLPDRRQWIYTSITRGSERVSIVPYF